MIRLETIFAGRKTPLTIEKGANGQRELFFAGGVVSERMPIRLIHDEPVDSPAVVDALDLLKRRGYKVTVIRKGVIP